MSVLHRAAVANLDRRPPEGGYLVVRLADEDGPWRLALAARDAPFDVIHYGEDILAADVAHVEVVHTADGYELRDGYPEPGQ